MTLRTAKSLKNSWFCVLISTAVFFSIEVSYANPKGVRKYVMCRNGKIVRTIRVEPNPSDSSSWVTTYTKNGVDSIVGHGRNPASCDDVLERVQKTLEAHSWKCKDMENAVIHKDTAGI